MQGTVMTRYPLLRHGQKGISLVETIVAIVVLAIALIGVASSIQSGVTRSANTIVELRAVALAQSYLDEILGKRFDENTRPRGTPPCRAGSSRTCTDKADFGSNYTTPVESGENSRSRLDDVDDYDGMVEGDGETRPLEDADGNEREGYENFKVEVTVDYILGTEPELNKANENTDVHDAKIITVTVSYRGLDTGFDFSAFKSNF